MEYGFRGPKKVRTLMNNSLGVKTKASPDNPQLFGFQTKEEDTEARWESSKILEN